MDDEPNVIAESTADVFREHLSELEAFLPGGGQVADFVGRPGRPFVDGGSSGGVRAAVEWFVGSILRSQERSVLFLIGAPGNGKSFWSANLVRELELHGYRDPLADGVHRRSYTYLKEAMKVTVVNDATASDGSHSPTTRQLSEAFATGNHLQININRGVFFRELAAPWSGSPSPADKAAREVMQWLSTASGRGGGSEALELGGSEHGFTVSCAPVECHESVLVARVLVGDLPPTTVVAVRMDLHSILEVEPSPVVDSGRWGVASFSREYRVTRPSARNWDSTDFWKKTAAGRILHGVGGILKEEIPVDFEQLNPIKANIDHLSEPRFANGFLSVMRTAELSSGRHFAVRHVWAGVATAVLGKRLGEGADAGPLTACERLDNLSRNLPENGLDRLVALITLSNHRTHQAIFGASIDPNVLTASSESPGLMRSVHPSDFVRVLSRVDPSQDAMPGYASRESLLNREVSGPGRVREGWCSPVTQAFRAVLEEREERGKESILEEMRRLADSKMNVQIVSCDFDRELDNSIVEMLRADRTPSPWLDRGGRDSVLGWYSDYLSRLLGMYLGRGARLIEVAEYVENWLEAEDGSLVDETADNLLALILPSFAGDDAVPRRLVGLFRPRTEAITRPSSTPRLVADIKRIELAASVSGDSILLTLNQRRGMKIEQLLTIILDADLLAETRLGAGSYRGVSERTAGVTPMIERFRASAANAGVWSVLEGEKVMSLR